MTFYSTSLRDRLAEIFTAVKLVSPADLEKERELTQRKWFAYRFMSPLAATHHFADLYRDGLRQHARVNQDIERAESIKGMSANMFSKPSGSLTALWRARQHTDALGVPYELLIEFAFEFAGRRTRRAAPRPNQLFWTEKSEAAWKSGFEKYRLERLPMAFERLFGLPQFRTENYRGYPAQVEFRASVIGYIKSAERSWHFTVRRQHQ